MKYLAFKVGNTLEVHAVEEYPALAPSGHSEKSWVENCIRETQLKIEAAAAAAVPAAAELVDLAALDETKR